MRLGIAGYARSGKDEVASFFEEKLGFIKINMSDALDKYLQILNPCIFITDHEAQDAGLRSGGFYRYQELCERLDFTTRKTIKDVRELLQRLGTDVGRAIDPNLWVRELEKEADKYDYVVTTGIRFVEEALPCDLLIHVDRPGFGPVNDHSSEKLDRIFEMCDVKILNNGTLEDLAQKTHNAAVKLGLVVL